MPPSWPAIRTWSAFAFATPAATVPTPTSATSFTEIRAPRVGAAQVVDQLLEVLDRVDVVVRRRRDQADARRRVADRADVVVDLVAGQLAALAGLGALGHLDLQLVGVDEVVDRSRRSGPEATCLIAERRESPFGSGVKRTRVLPALAGVRLAAEAVHRDRERLVRLARDRAERHRAGREALDDLARRLDLVERDRAPSSASRNSSSPRSVARARRVLVDELASTRRRSRRPPWRTACWSERDRLRVPHVVLAVAAPRVDAADRQQVVVACAGRPRAWRSSASRASTSMPMPPIRDAVPVKWRSISSGSRPTASKICAPQ